VYVRCTLRIREKKSNPARQNWRPTIEDDKLLKELQEKLGVSASDVIRIGLRRLAEAEGIVSGR